MYHGLGSVTRTVNGAVGGSAHAMQSARIKWACGADLGIMLGPDALQRFTQRGGELQDLVRLLLQGRTGLSTKCCGCECLRATRGQGQHDQAPRTVAAQLTFWKRSSLSAMVPTCLLNTPTS